jgi:hypothetical protein
MKISRTGKLGRYGRLQSRNFPIGNFLVWNASPALAEREMAKPRAAIAAQSRKGNLLRRRLRRP